MIHTFIEGGPQNLREGEGVDIFIIHGDYQQPPLLSTDDYLVNTLHPLKSKSIILIACFQKIKFVYF